MMARSGIIAVLAFLMVAAGGFAGEAPMKGALVVCGGAALPDSARDRFVELAGGPEARIVVIPTASESADAEGPERDGALKPWIAKGVASATLLHARSRDQANEPGFVERIDEATGVWFGGGDQSRIVDAYLGTAVEDALRRLLDRGGVIGGTSAGAAIMSRVMITGGTDKATVGAGFGFLPGVVVDQHALRRNRVNRLLGVLADHPDLTGLAIDEGTALVVANGRWRVVGQSYVMIVHPSNSPFAGRFDFRHDGDEGNVDGWRLDDRRAQGDR